MKKDWDYYRLQWGIMKARFAGDFMLELMLLDKQKEYRG